MTLWLVVWTNVSLEYGSRGPIGRQSVKSICGRASWLRVCPMPVITLCVNIPAPCSTLNYPLVPSVYRTSICIRSFRAGRRNTIGIRPGTGGDSNLLETYRAIPPPPPFTRLSLTIRFESTSNRVFPPLSSSLQILQIYIYIVKRPSFTVPRIVIRSINVLLFGIPPLLDEGEIK